MINYTNKIKLYTSIFVLITLNSCNSIINKIYDDTTAKYNAYFVANEIINDIELNLENNYYYLKANYRIYKERLDLDNLHLYYLRYSLKHDFPVMRVKKVYAKENCTIKDEIIENCKSNL